MTLKEAGATNQDFWGPRCTELQNICARAGHQGKPGGAPWAPKAPITGQPSPLHQSAVPPGSCPPGGISVSITTVHMGERECPSSGESEGLAGEGAAWGRRSHAPKNCFLQWLRWPGFPRLRTSEARAGATWAAPDAAVLTAWTFLTTALICFCFPRQARHWGWVGRAAGHGRRPCRTAGAHAAMLGCTGRQPLSPPDNDSTCLSEMEAGSVPPPGHSYHQAPTLLVGAPSPWSPSPWQRN